jgi:hypothetical protein
MARRGFLLSAEFVGHRLDLENEPALLFRHLEGSCRRAVKKAERAGVEIEIASDMEALGAFYGLHCRTRRKHGLPPQPFSFFESIGKELVNIGAGFVALARVGGGRYADGRPTRHGRVHRGELVAGAVILLHGDRAVYKFGASDESRLGCRPNNLVLWKSILHCRARGCRQFEFGRTDIANEGLRRFKLSFGATEYPVDYYLVGKSRAANRSVKCGQGWHNIVFRNAPLFANRWLGALLYPHLD